MRNRGPGEWVVTRLGVHHRNILAPNFWGRGNANWFGTWESRTNQRKEKEGRVGHAGGEWRREFVARGFVCENLKSLHRRGCGAC